MLQTREQKPRVGVRERDTGETVCVPFILLLSVEAGSLMGAVRRRLDGGGRPGTRI